MPRVTGTSSDSGMLKAGTGSSSVTKLGFSSAADGRVQQLRWCDGACRPSVGDKPEMPDALQISTAMHYSAEQTRHKHTARRNSGRLMQGRADGRRGRGRGSHAQLKAGVAERADARKLQRACGR